MNWYFQQFSNSLTTSDSPFGPVFVYLAYWSIALEERRLNKGFGATNQNVLFQLYFKVRLRFDYMPLS